MNTSGCTPARRLVTHHDPQGAVAEAFRVLRTNLEFLDLSRPLRSITVASAIPGEGKSFIAANLAVACAQSGMKTCLVDADLRRPAVATYFRHDSVVGLTTALVRDKPAREATAPSSVPGLAFIPSGPLPPNPAELLGSARMRALMAELADEYDLVIYDTPPVLTVADPTVIAPRTDGVLLVAQAGRVRREQTRAAANALTRVGARVLGVVLNATRRRGGDESRYYYSRHA